MPQHQANLRVVFMGDSITDAGRDRSQPRDMGSGYAALVAAWFMAQHPDQPVDFWNRGISGDRVRDLAARWQTDCLALQPTLVSILIGINDVWRRYDAHDPTTLEAFVAPYRLIITQTQAAGATVVLCEPFLAPVSPDQAAWREDLDPKLAAIRSLAAEYGAALVALDRAFTHAAGQRAPATWAADGVHPTLPGHALIAQAWLGVVGATLMT